MMNSIERHYRRLEARKRTHDFSQWDNLWGLLLFAVSMTCLMIGIFVEIMAVVALSTGEAGLGEALINFNWVLGAFAGVCLLASIIVTLILGFRWYSENRWLITAHYRLFWRHRKNFSLQVKTKPDQNQSEQAVGE